MNRELVELIAGYLPRDSGFHHHSKDRAKAILTAFEQAGYAVEKKDKIEKVQRALGWALEQLDMLAIKTDHGTFTSGYRMELVGFEVGRSEARAAYRDETGRVT